jgi:chaperonin GroEL (HSP60 family)
VEDLPLRVCVCFRLACLSESDTDEVAEQAGSSCPSLLPIEHAVAPGGEIASTFDHPEDTKLGRCKLIEEIMIGEDRLIHFSGVALGEACTIVLRGASEGLGFRV